MDNIEDSKLTIDELNFFRKRSAEERKTMNILRIVFVISWGTILGFSIVYLISEMSKGENPLNATILFIIVIGMGIVFGISDVKIKKRRQTLYQAIQNGEYELIISQITKKDYRIIGTGKARRRIDFYCCSNSKDEIAPCTGKQYRTAKIGDTLRVIKIPKLHISFGFLV